MPITEKVTDRSPKLGFRKKKKGGSARKDVRKQNWSGPPVPMFSRKPLPDLDSYPKRADGKPKVHLCPGKEFKGMHEPDMVFAGWAKGHGDGTFDVSCHLCGEAGRIVVKVRPRDVQWG